MVTLQEVPESSQKSHDTQQRLTAAAVLASRKSWSKVDPDYIDESWMEAAPAMAAVLTRLQSEAAANGARYIPLSLADQGFEVDPAYNVKPRAVAGFAGAGYAPLDVFESAPIVAKSRISKGWSVTDAMAAGGAILSGITQTAMADAGRQGQALAIHSRPGVGYVRMLTPPSCSRCAILAGRSSGRTAFDRHPRCDCTAVPGLRDWEQGLTLNTGDYFESLPSAADLADQFPDMTIKERRAAGHTSQEDVFTKAGAKAIRDGADPTQIVNARRGMSQIQRPGSVKWLVTAEGNTRRGQAAQAMRRGGIGEVRKTRRGGRYQRTVAQRLMPETIYQVARNEEDARRLLKLYGYI